MPKLFNITRTAGSKVEIFLRNLEEKEARIQLRHWKRLARHCGGKVYFTLFEVPEELTPAGQEALSQARYREGADAFIAMLDAELGPFQEEWRNADRPSALLDVNGAPLPVREVK